MGSVGIGLSVFGAQMALGVMQLARLAKFDCSVSEGSQGFVGGVTTAILLFAAGITVVRWENSHWNSPDNEA
jgi:hypothetical protein